MPPKRHALSRMQASLPSGPSLLVDDGQSTQQILANGGVLNQPAPQRPKIHVTEQAMDEALQLSTEGKITSKNAWDIKLIEGLDDSVRHCITDSDGQDDQYQQFTRAANLVEGGAKVWTHRVESTYLLSTQMVRRLLRNDGREEVAADEEGDKENGTQQPTRKKKKNLERTIAASLEEIDQDRSQRAAQTQGTISPMFRAMTEKFDQGHAQGLLSHNVPFGSRLNHILDIDFALMSDKEGSVPTTLSEVRESQSQAGLDAEETPDTPAEDFAVPMPRLSQNSASPMASRLSGSAKSPAFSMDMGADGLQTHMIPRTMDVTMSGVNSRAGSVAAMSAVGNADTSSAFGEYDQQPDFDDGDNGEWGDDDAADEEGVDNSDARSMARGVATGASSIDALDTFLGSREALLGIAAEDAEWTPLATQGPTTAFGAQKSSKVMTNIRNQSVLGKKAGAKAGEGGDTEDVLASKRKKTEKGATSALTKIPTDLFEMDRVDPKMNRTVNTALTPLGRKWMVDDFDGSIYVKKELQMQRAQEHNFILNAQYDSATVTRECPTLTYIPDEPSDVRAFFQPFSCHEPGWNVLYKTLRHANQAAGATSNIGRFDGAGFTEDVVAEMPVDVFMDNDDGGYDDDADYGADVTFDVPAGPQIDLPDFGGDMKDDELPEELPPAGPEAIKRLRMTYATAPTQVDVVRLRRVMWEHTQRVAHARPADAEGNAVVAATQQQQLAARSSGKVVFDGDEHHFSDVVASMLPQVPSIAKGGSLSPAFFFFSMLFLVNQHGIDLHQGEGGDLNDLLIKGLIQPGVAPDTNQH